MFSKLIYALLFVLFVVLALVCYETVSAEGTKVLTFPDKTQITVPELAPEFQNWDALILAQEVYSNGNGLCVAQFISPNEQIMVIALFGKRGDKVFLLGFAVKYVNSKNAEFEIYEDLGFLKTGHSSGHFVRVDEASPTDAFKFHLMNIKI